MSQNKPSSKFDLWYKMMPGEQAHKIVVIETDPIRRNFLKTVIAGWGGVPFNFERVSICLDNLPALQPDLIISSQLSNEKSIRLIHSIKSIDFDLPILVISYDQRLYDFINENGFINTRIIRENAAPGDIRAVVESLLNPIVGSRANGCPPLFVGQSAEIVKIKRMMAGLSRSNESVLIRGEAGTGKEHLAQLMQSLCFRSKDPFVKVCSGAIDPGGTASGLFDLEAPGVDEPSDSVGIRFGTERRGTLFLKEIEKLPATHQSQLLYLMENNASQNSDGEAAMDVRVIASTTTDLEALARAGRFRMDLYFRLNTIRIDLPPLRDRVEDISILCDFFVDSFCWKYDKSHYELSGNTKSILGSYHWPGNVAELKQIVEHIVRADNEDQLAEKFRRELAKGLRKDSNDTSEDIQALEQLSDLKQYYQDLNKASLKEISREYVALTERLLMKKVLEHTRWNRKKAASALNISYKSLLNKIKAYELG